MDVFEAIEKRHSYRGKFLEKAVPREDLEKIVQAGIQAPSGCNGQSTTFVIIDDRDKLNRVAEILGNQSLKEAQAVIACIMDPNATRDRGFDFGVEDYSAAVENMLLAVTALGYATVWIDGVLRRNNTAERIGELLGVPEDRTVRVVLPVGVPAEEQSQKEKKSFSERAWFNRYEI